MIEDTPGRKTGKECFQFSGLLNPLARIEHHDLRPYKVESLRCLGPRQQFTLVEPLFNYIDQFSAQIFQVMIVCGIYERQPFCKRLVMNAVPGPDGKVVLKFRVIETWPQESAPEMVVDTAELRCLEPVPQFTQGLCMLTGGNGDQRAVFQSECLCHHLASLIRF